MKILISSNYKKHFDTNIDFLDHHWINYFNKKNYQFELIPNSLKIAKKKIKQNKSSDLIIIPGGNDLFESDYLSMIRLKVEKELINCSLKNKIPLLGVCRGMQVINHYFGGKIKKIDKHMKTNHKIIFIKKIFKRKKMKVNSFHNFCIPEKLIAKEFLIYAKDETNNIEMFKHKKMKMYGVMWHPEREKNYRNLTLLIKKILI